MTEAIKEHAILECPECGKPCKPYKEKSDGGAYYRCRAENSHDDNRAIYFRIDADGELYI